MKKLSVTLLSLTLMSSSVFAGGFAATISDFSGKVLINQGHGFVPAAGVMSLNAGDKVMVGENSFAVVSYADCAVSLSKPTVLSIVSKAPCVAKSGDVAASDDAALISPAASAPYVPVPLILLGGAAVVGVGLYAAGVFDSNNKPASP